MEKRSSKLRMVLTYGGLLLAVVCLAPVIVAAAQSWPAGDLTREMLKARMATSAGTESVEAAIGAGVVAGINRGVESGEGVLEEILAIETTELAFPETGMSQRVGAMAAPMAILQDDPTLLLQKSVTSQRNTSGSS